MNKLLFSLGVITFALVLGYTLQILINRGIVRLPWEIRTFRARLQKAGLLFFLPIAFLGAIWIVEVQDLRIVALPILGTAILLTGAFLGFAASKILRLGPKQTGVMICCTFFSNLGAVGSLVCYVFLGEVGFALVALYRMFEMILYYTIGFPVAKYYSGATKGEGVSTGRLKQIFLNPFALVAMSALTIGISLNIVGVPRPAFYETITAVFVPTGTIVMLTSIGMGIRLRRLGGFFKQSLAVSVIKFLIMPALAGTGAYFLGFRDIADGLPLRVVLILASMPVAFVALVPATIYDLDLDLANSCWLWTTLELLVVLPWLYFLTGIV